MNESYFAALVYLISLLVYESVKRPNICCPTLIFSGPPERVLCNASGAECIGPGICARSLRSCSWNGSPMTPRGRSRMPALCPIKQCPISLGHDLRVLSWWIRRSIALDNALLLVDFSVRSASSHPIGRKQSTVMSSHVHLACANALIDHIPPIKEGHMTPKIDILLFSILRIDWQRPGA